MCWFNNYLHIMILRNLKYIVCSYKYREDFFESLVRSITVEALFMGKAKSSSCNQTVQMKILIKSIIKFEYLE